VHDYKTVLLSERKASFCGGTDFFFFDKVAGGLQNAKS
jgi:hypothetical protein